MYKYMHTYTHSDTVIYTLGESNLSHTYVSGRATTYSMSRMNE